MSALSYYATCVFDNYDNIFNIILNNNKQCRNGVISGRFTAKMNCLRKALPKIYHMYLVYVSRILFIRIYFNRAGTTNGLSRTAPQGFLTTTATTPLSLPLLYLIILFLKPLFRIRIRAYSRSRYRPSTKKNMPLSLSSYYITQPSPHEFSSSLLLFS